MRGHRLAIAAVLAMFGPLGGGCAPDPVKDAEERAAIVEQRGSNREVCDAKRKVADAHLQKKDGKGYELAKLSADVTCLSAEMSPDEPYNDTLAADYLAIEPDNMEALAEAAPK